MQLKGLFIQNLQRINLSCKIIESNQMLMGVSLLVENK